MNNLFGKERPVTYSALDISNASAYDPALNIDRYFYVRYNQKF